MPPVKQTSPKTTDKSRKNVSTSTTNNPSSNGTQVHNGKESTINNIAESLLPLAVPIESLVPDPQNARLHPEDNLESIKLSLSQYGQLKPIVVRRDSNVVVAGNGTMEAAKQLGWTSIAAVFHNLSDIEAIGFGIADNRTAELAKWDWQTLKILESILQKDGQPIVGWTDKQIKLLRTNDWSPPSEEEILAASIKKKKPILLSFTQDQYDMVSKAITMLKNLKNDDKMDESSCIIAVCDAWLEAVNEGRI